MAEPAGLRYEGIRELAQALKQIDDGLLHELTADLKNVGEVVREQATSLFDRIDVKTAAGFETRVRATSRSGGLVTVEQKLRKTTGRRPDYGGLQVRYMLEAREEKLGEAAQILEDGAHRLLREHGF